MMRPNLLEQAIIVEEDVKNLTRQKMFDLIVNIGYAVPIYSMIIYHKIILICGRCGGVPTACAFVCLCVCL
jgi:hypothetical protein